MKEKTRKQLDYVHSLAEKIIKDHPDYDRVDAAIMASLLAMSNNIYSLTRSIDNLAAAVEKL